MTEQIGTRWYKCDLHIHTTSSECHLDKTVTPEQWVRRCKEQGLDVAAVTDHNDYRSIDAYRAEGEKQGLGIFPGTEITCDSTKIHMVILFDTNKNGDTVRDFLNKCDIDSDLIGLPDGTSMSVFEVCAIAKKRGAMVIAAHIDEFNAISSMNTANLDKILSTEYIDAVQVSNYEIWEKYRQDKDSDAMYSALREKYGEDATPEEIERWRKCYERAVIAGIPVIAASDNPASPEESKHGLWGIGCEYTWIKMNENIDLESIYQSLYSPDTRLRTCFESPDSPARDPEFWICSLEARKTSLNPHQSIRLDFCPQMNCVIGGRGSGKSAVVRILSGAYGILPDASLKDVRRYQDSFYSLHSEENAHGIFLEGSEIEIVFSCFGHIYKLVDTDITDTDHRTVTYYRRTGSESDGYGWEVIDDDIFLDIIKPNVYTEKQINDITGSPASLIRLIDEAIPDIYILKEDLKLIAANIFNELADIRSLEHYIANETRIREELQYVDEALSAASNALGSDVVSRLTVAKSTGENALEKIARSKQQLEELKKELKNTVSAYEAMLRDIRAKRSELIDHVMAEDENFLFEIMPRSDRDSFTKLLVGTLPADLTLLEDDIAKLSAVLFAPKNGVKKYREELDNIRSGAATGYTTYFTRLIRTLSEPLYDRLYMFYPEDSIQLSYHPNGIERFFPMTTASSGQKAVAILSFILACGSMPLVIDQPEDDIDNRVLYEEIITKIKRARQHRQLIFVTHNANIPVNADSELIISMDAHSKFRRVKMAGTLDDADIRREICDVMEGTEAAFLQRARKYHLEQN